MSGPSSARRQTVVAVHAHPDDESLLTGGTLARLAADGHRVVLAVATSGGRGLAADDRGLAARRASELHAAATALGCARVVELGYRDSGWDAATRTPLPGGFATEPLDEVAARLANILRAERADLVIGYDPNGGYGHPDHVRVHEAVRAAALLAGTPRVLEATLDRTIILRVVRLLRWSGLLPAGTAAAVADRWYTPRAAITHRVPVRSVLDSKRRALSCHVSQISGGRGPRTVGLLLRIPRPLFRLVAGVEWFTEPGAQVTGRPLTDLLLPAGPGPSASDPAAADPAAPHPAVAA